jgi:hypothetical protein
MSDEEFKKHCADVGGTVINMLLRYKLRLKEQPEGVQVGCIYASHLKVIENEYRLLKELLERAKRLCGDCPPPGGYPASIPPSPPPHHDLPQMWPYDPSKHTPYNPPEMEQWQMEIYYAQTGRYPQPTRGASGPGGSRVPMSPGNRPQRTNAPNPTIPARR